VRPLFLLRWSLRDLRRRWLQVIAIALIIAVGSGVYAALGSTATWRYESNDASFAALGMYDLRVTASEGVDAPAGSMLAALDRLPDPAMVADAEERLVAATQVDASTPDEPILVPGRIIGVDTSAGGPDINRVWVEPGAGRTLAPGDAGSDTVVLERNFATYYDLPTSGEVSVGGTTVRYVGQAMSPEYLFVLTEEGGFFAEANFAVVFAPLDTAQALAGRAGRVNDLVLRLRPGTDVEAAATQVEAALAPEGLGVTTMQRHDEAAYQMLYDDIESDRQFWNIFAGLILAGAAFGAFNLASRMVEAQRREIGIGMALGESPRMLALRPLLVGLEIAVLGGLFGVGMGLVVAEAIRPVYREMLPLPIWYTPLQWGMFARAAALGVLVPLVATAWPVWRAVRVLPVDAITTTHRNARGGLAPLLRRLGWPRGTFARMPVGNVLRTPRRTLLTALGIGAAITALVSTLGMIDSFLATTDRYDSETLGEHPDRVAVALQGLQPVGGDVLAAIRADPTVGAVAPVLRFGGRLSTDQREPIDVAVDLIDLSGDVWAPTFAQGTLPADRRGLVIAEKAARDLGVEPGDQVVLEHPAVRGTGFEVVETELTVAGIHPSPFRFAAYMDRSQLSAFGVPDVANQLYVLPAAGSTPAAVQRALFGQPGVASVQPVSVTSQAVQDSLDEFVAIFRVLELFILLLALLIAYNATSINTDERAREHSTLFAFGLPMRRVLRMDVTEGVLIGLLGTAIGILGGLVVLRWMIETLFEATSPEMGVDLALSTATVIQALVLGVVAVAVAPLLTVRRLRRMDIPGTLRVVE
jgi:putative ABC transport system permease protein